MGAGKLYNCVWDLAKMGAACARDSNLSASLIAGAPTVEWDGNAEGVGYLGEGTSATDELLVTHKKSWAKWATEVKTRPLFLPARISTQPLTRIKLPIEAQTWELRAAEVTALPAWMAVPDETRAEAGTLSPGATSRL